VPSKFSCLSVKWLRFVFCWDICFNLTGNDRSVRTDVLTSIWMGWPLPLVSCQHGWSLRCNSLVILPVVVFELFTDCLLFGVAYMHASMIAFNMVMISLARIACRWEWYRYSKRICQYTLRAVMYWLAFIFLISLNDFIRS